MSINPWSSAFATDLLVMGEIGGMLRYGFLVIRISRRSFGGIGLGFWSNQRGYVLLGVMGESAGRERVVAMFDVRKVGSCLDVNIFMFRCHFQNQKRL